MSDIHPMERERIPFTRDIAFAAAWLGISRQRFIDLSVENQLADMADTIPLFAEALRQVTK